MLLIADINITPAQVMVPKCYSLKALRIVNGLLMTFIWAQTSGGTTTANAHKLICNLLLMYCNE